MNIVRFLSRKFIWSDLSELTLNFYPSFFAVCTNMCPALNVFACIFYNKFRGIAVPKPSSVVKTVFVPTKTIFYRVVQIVILSTICVNVVVIVLAVGCFKFSFKRYNSVSEINRKVFSKITSELQAKHRSSCKFFNMIKAIVYLAEECQRSFHCFKPIVKYFTFRNICLCSSNLHLTQGNKQCCQSSGKTTARHDQGQPSNQSCTAFANQKVFDLQEAEDRTDNNAAEYNKRKRRDPASVLPQRYLHKLRVFPNLQPLEVVHA